MLILVTGGPGTASAWVSEAVSQALIHSGVQLMNPEVTNKKLRKHGISEDIKFHDGPTGFSICDCSHEKIVMQVTSQIEIMSSIKAIDCFFLPWDIKEVISQAKEHVFFLGTHMEMGKFLCTDLRQSLSAILFTHRNPIDEMASFSRLYGISDSNMEKLDCGEPIDEIFYDVKTNAKNYLVKQSDAQLSILWKRHSMHTIRNGYIDFLKAKNMGMNVHDFRFENVTVHHELAEIERIISALDLEVNAEEIFAFLNRNKKPGKLGFHKNKEKFNIGHRYFRKSTYRQLMDFFGDVMVLFDYATLADYSSFLSENKEVSLVRIGSTNTDHDDAEFLLQRICCLVGTKNVSIEQFSKVEFIDSKRYVIIPESYTAYELARKHLAMHNIDNAIIYPFYDALYGYRELLFDLDKKETVFMDQIPTQCSNIAFIACAGFPIEDRDYFEKLRRGLWEQKVGFVYHEVDGTNPKIPFLNFLDHHVTNLSFFSEYTLKNVLVFSDEKLAGSFEKFSKAELEGVSVVGNIVVNRNESPKSASIPDLNNIDFLNVDDCIIVLGPHNDEQWLKRITNSLVDKGVDRFFIIYSHLLIQKKSFDYIPNDTGIIDTAIICSNRPSEIHKLARNLPSTIKKISLLPVFRYQDEPLVPIENV